jgi:hypothetical protein
MSAVKELREVLPQGVQAGYDAVCFHADETVSVFNEVVRRPQVGQTAGQLG